ncbi:MAG: orotate phosphoribosyltransferase [Myxococcota bacterium]
MTQQGAERQRLLELMRERSFERRKVVLSSGKESDFYIDCRATALLAEGHFLIGRLLLEKTPPNVKAAGGLTLGADPLASALAHTSWLEGRPVDAFIVRKEPKKHGTARFIESPLLPKGAEVVVLEDVVTTGASTLLAIERVREAGHVPVKVIALVDRLEGGREAIEAAGVEVESIFDRTDFIPGEAP